MIYPIISDYKHAVKNPESYFDKLLPLEMVPDERGFPKFASGNFAVVFKMRKPNNGKMVAIKCFHKDAPQRYERSQIIADYLRKNPSNYLIPYEYLPEELYIDSTTAGANYYPVVYMEWVEGLTLYEAVSNYCRKKDVGSLQQLYSKFIEMALWLLNQPYAHGDLKHDNILVTPKGELVLVDYDGMYVPGLEQYEANELGGASYQHPDRKKEDFDRNIDDFSIAVIAISLRALRLNPRLFTNNGNTIFLEKDDFIRFGKSKNILNLYGLKDEILTRLLNEVGVSIKQQSLKIDRLDLCLIRECAVTLNMILVEGGSFTSGDYLQPSIRHFGRSMQLVNCYYISSKPVSFNEFDIFCKNTNRPLPRDFGWGRDNRPVVDVSWLDALAYCNWLSIQHGYAQVYGIPVGSNAKNIKYHKYADGYRLLTEIEWEFAARERGEKALFGNSSKYIDSNLANFDESTFFMGKEVNYIGRTLPCGSYPPNKLGLYDMSGNVWEWCWDEIGSIGEGVSKIEAYKVIKGGSWASSIVDCRVTSRQKECSTARSNNIGFRIARNYTKE